MQMPSCHTYPLVLMVSGGSDSTALLELASRWASGQRPAQAPGEEGLLEMLDRSLPPADDAVLSALHVNYGARGEDSDADEAFVRGRCEALGVPCTVRRTSPEALALDGGEGFEASARSFRYRAAEETADEAQARLGEAAGEAVVCTAHTLDDRVETFYMRSLVGTGPGGLGSIPRVRGRIRRPLLDATREELRSWLRVARPGVPDAELWREDATNVDGSNFRSRVREELLPVLRGLRPGFERPLARTMDLLSEEDEGLDELVDSLVYRTLSWDGETARLPVAALSGEPRFIARRMLRSVALVVRPDARLESAQIERVLDGLATPGFATELSGGVRVRIDGDELVAFVAQ